MFVRTKVIRQNQKEYRYLQIVHNQRVKGRVKQKVLFTSHFLAHRPREVSRLPEVPAPQFSLQLGKLLQKDLRTDTFQVTIHLGLEG